MDGVIDLEIRETTSTQGTIQLLGHYLRPYGRRMVLLTGLLLVGIGLQLANPQILRYFLDAARAGASDSALFQAAGIFLAFALLQQVLAAAVTWVGEDLGWRSTNQLREDLVRHTLQMEMAFHKRHTPGELIERLDGDVNALANFFSQLTVRVLGNLVLIVGILFFLFRENFWIGAGMTLYAGVTLLVLSGLLKTGVRKWAAYRQIEADLMGFLEERLTGTEDIRANGAVGQVRARFAELNATLLRLYRPAHMAKALNYTVTYGLYALGYGLGLGLGVYLYLNGKATLGTAYVLLYYIATLEGPLQEIRRQAGDFQQALASVGRVQGLLARAAAVREPEKPAGLPQGELEVEFKGVTFEYRDEAPAGGNGAGERDFALRDLCFQLEAGRVLGVLGRTGSGKTTLTRLLFRLYEPTAGEIRLAGVPLGTVPRADVRRRVGMVTQEVQLFRATLRDNVAFFDPAVCDAQILETFEWLGLMPWYRTLKEGLNTFLGAGGIGVSAGQAQLLAFARVFLKDPGVVILDEASAHLDPATEQLLERAVDRLLVGRTGLIIAHRLATVRRADDILILDGGRAVEYGPRVALAGDSQSRFARLLQTGLEEVLA